MSRRLQLAVLVTALLVLAAARGISQGKDQAKDTLADEMTTEERLARSPWWPTKFGSANDKYSGTASCAECHAEITREQQKSEMGQTLMPAAQSKAADFAGKRVTVDGFVYEFLSAPSGIAYTLPDSKDATQHSLTWAFGSGAISQVYFTPGATTSNESHFSYFEGIPGFDVTPAQPALRVPNRAPGQDSDTSHKEAGRIVPMPETRRCFSCHAANVPAEGPITNIIAGVTCEACHGPVGDHVAAERAGLPQAGALIMNPGRLRPVDQVDYCGSCHATSIDVQLSGSMGLPSVRFPAYRLQNSTCWSNDARIQCTACHDPHKPLQRGSASYDEKCFACHQSSVSAKPDAVHPGKACPTATKDCAGCHMPKYEFPDVHHKFTDHQIRVVKPGEHVPA